MIILNNHYMLVGKYIFVIFLNRFVKANFRGMGVGSGAKAPSILKFDIFLPNFLQKFCFLSFEWWKCNFTTSAPPAKSFLAHPWKIHCWPFPAKIFLAHPWKTHYWPLPAKKSFRRSCLGVDAHLSKCWRGTWPEKVWEPLLYKNDYKCSYSTFSTVIPLEHLAIWVARYATTLFFYGFPDKFWENTPSAV